MIDLLAELRTASRAVRQPHLDRLKGLGVSVAWAAQQSHDSGLPPFGVTAAEDAGDGLYQPSEGALHMVLPVVDDGALVDLVAFRSNDPGNWLLRTGHGWAMGMEQGMSRWLWSAPADPSARPPRYQLGQPPTLFSDPLDWLRGGGEGICVLDWGAPEVRYLDVLPELVCSTPAVRALLIQALSRPARLPKLSILEAAHVA
jgi:hypothetical protein